MFLWITAPSDVMRKQKFVFRYLSQMLRSGETGPSV